MKQAGAGSFTSGGKTNIRPALLLALSAFIPVVLICGIVGFFVIRAEMTALDQMIVERTDRLAVALSRELETQVQLLSILSESPRLDPPIEEQAFAEIGDRLRVRIPVWEMLRISDLEGRLVLSVPPSSRAKPGDRVVDAESHRQLLESKRAVIGNIALGPRRLPAFPIRVPVIRRGEVVSGLTAVMRPKSLNGILHTNGLPPSWIGWIIDAKGRLVASTAEVTEFVTQPAERLVQVAMPREHELASGRLYSGEALRVASMAVAGTDWRVGVGMPMAQYSRVSMRGLYVLGASGGITLLLTGLGLLLLQRELEARRRREAELANWQRMDALGKLTGGIAHDFNNLLMTFQSSAESLRRRRDDETRVERLLQGMLEAVDRGRTLTQRLLSYSRRSNQDAMAIRLQDRVETLREILDKAAQDAVALKIDFPDDLWAVHVDPQAMETTLINLVTNAREAMASGGEVVVSARNVPDLKAETARLSGPGIAVSVADTGGGISAADMPRIFEPFYTTKGNDSPGLGLSQVHAFAERSGGAVTVSEAGPRGAIFTIYLPRHVPATGSALAAAGPPRLPGRVLVVDDTPSSLAASRLALEDLGIEAVAVSSGRAALAALQGSGPFEAVLTDIRMPGMSGLELAEYIRALDPHIAVVLMTGFSEAVEGGGAIDLPVLMKPFTTESLKETLMRPGNVGLSPRG